MKETKSHPIFNYRLLLAVCLIAALSWYATTVFRPKGAYAKGILRTGELEMLDGRKVAMDGVKIKPIGDEKHEAAIFLLSEMTKSNELWIERGGEGYKIWIGCKSKLVFLKDCSDAILVNEKLVELGLADRI